MYIIFLLSFLYIYMPSFCIIRIIIEKLFCNLFFSLKTILGEILYILKILYENMIFNGFIVIYHNRYFVLNFQTICTIYCYIPGLNFFLQKLLGISLIIPFGLISKSGITGQKYVYFKDFFDKFTLPSQDLHSQQQYVIVCSSPLIFLHPCQY